MNSPVALFRSELRQRYDKEFRRSPNELPKSGDTVRVVELVMPIGSENHDAVSGGSFLNFRT